MKHKTHRRALTSDFPCRPSLIALGVHVEFAVAATRPAPPSAKPAVVKAAGVAIDCNRADVVPSKACALCGVTKPLSAFAADRWNPGKHNRRCRACIGAISPPCDDEAGGEVTFDSLTDNARRLKGEAAVYQHGRSKITAVFDKKTDTTRYAVSGWPCPPADLQYIFRLIESGQPVRGLP